MTAPGENTVRLRRSKSLNEVDDFRRSEEIIRKAQPDRPCHKYQDSLFSWSSGFSDFSGFVNWAFLLLLMGGIRLLLENLLKYGVRVDPMQWFLLMFAGSGNEYNASYLLLSYSVVPVFLCLSIEKAVVQKILTENAAFVLQITNTTLIIILPMVTITSYTDQFGWLSATVICFLYSVIFLKLWSYVQVNMWCRKKWLEKENQKLKHRMSSMNHRLYSVNSEKAENEESINMNLVMYPNNLNVKDIFYFIAIPTLCYELNFPRTDRIRKRFIIKRILELIIGFHVIVAVLQQWTIPSVKHSLIPFSVSEGITVNRRLKLIGIQDTHIISIIPNTTSYEIYLFNFLQNMDILKTTERLLKLSIPNHLLWLILFYLIFHSLLNFVGELFHFADRNFYLDWWNAPNSNVFWRKWNTAVHRWALRHVYLPMVDMGCSKLVASLAVFFISAFFHEFLVSIPLRTYRSWAFVGMMAQVPLAYVSTYMERRYGPRWGNLIVWLSLILGQPLCIMMYYHDYVISHYGEALLEQFGHL